MQLVLIAMLVVVGLMGVAACANQELIAPTTPAAGPRLQIMGDLPTSHLVEAGGFTYLPGVGVEVTVALNQGLLNAAQDGQADFQIVTRLFASNAGGQARAISPKSDPLVLLKTFLTDGEFSYAKVVVPWDGLDVDGNVMTGQTDLEYQIEIVNFRPNPNGDGIVIDGAAAGLTTLFLPDGTP